MSIGDGTTRPLWSPDSRHLLTSKGRTGSLILYTADGQQIASYADFVDPTWLGDDTFLAYRGYPPSNAKPVDIDAVMGNATDGSVTDTSFPCCNTLGNGAGAVVVFWFPPHPGSPHEQAQYSVWSNGKSTDARPGFPDEWSAWSPAGDKLVIEHPFGSPRVFAPEGWGEVLTWPGLNRIFEGDHNQAFGQVSFDPSGSYLAYQTAVDPAQADHVNDVHIVTLATGAVSTIPIEGDQFSFAWNAQSQLIVSDIAAGTLTTYSTAGGLVDVQQELEPKLDGTAVSSSVDGSSVLANVFGLSTATGTHLAVERNGHTTDLTYPPGDTSELLTDLSPNGQWLVAVTDQGAWLTQL